MSQTTCAVTCRWAIPTLFLPAPIWLDAADRPWTCTRTVYADVLETTEICRSCRYWTPRDPVVRSPVRPVEH